MILRVVTQIEEVEVETLEAQIAEVLAEEDDEVEETVGNTLYFWILEERQCESIVFFLLFSLDFLCNMIIYYFVMQGSIKT